MSREPGRYFTVCAGHDPLSIIARSVIQNSLFELPSRFPLAAWTILVPTRRAARKLGEIFLAMSASSSILIPRIQPIGDIDSEALELDPPAVTLPEALSDTAQLFEVVRAVDQWLAENPDQAIARDMADAPSQRINLARSMMKLMAQAETEEVTLDGIREVYDFGDAAGHREAILGLLGALTNRFDAIRDRQRQIGPSAHRNLMIREWSKRVGADANARPFLAAGSTGTNPATRELLRVIAHARYGAVILPGLDTELDQPSWNAVGPTHPQWGLKQLCEELAIERKEVAPLSDPASARFDLVRDVMQPTEQTHLWAAGLAARREALAAQMSGLHLFAADDRHIEARAIALILRETLEAPGKIAALVTPDRELAKRVKAELARWQIAIDDSAGEPLTRFGIASLLLAVMDCLRNESPDSLVGLLHHPMVTCGLPRLQYQEAAQAIEISVLRQMLQSSDPRTLAAGVERARAVRNVERHLHLAVKRIGDAVFADMTAVAIQIEAAFLGLGVSGTRKIAAHIESLVTALEILARPLDWTDPATASCRSVLDRLIDESERLGTVSFQDAAQLITLALAAEQVRGSANSQPRLAIYGLPEARMMSVDVAVLGGLNEGIWPHQPDPGPWLNRPMRARMKLQEPEREIGQTAHDLCEALGHATVYLTWSKRAGREPLVPSRWILRLRTIMRAIGAITSEVDATSEKAWATLALARRIDETQQFDPIHKPEPTPPVAIRPHRFSVTDIEKLIRDPYHIYARKILAIQPLDKLAADADARMRGIVFHSALEAWTLRAPNPSQPAGFDILKEEGRKAFEMFAGDPDVEAFWWPRFLRLAEAIVPEDSALRENVAATFVEQAGKLKFAIAGIEHILTARADRIDILSDGQARIIDYKSGAIPSGKQVKSGIAPQMTLEAAIVMQGGFETIGTRHASEAIYVHVTGSNPPVDLKYVGRTRDSEFVLAEQAMEHFQKLKEKLAFFTLVETAYPPRSSVMKVDTPSDYDHLSRFLEWNLRADDEP